MWARYPMTGLQKWAQSTPAYRGTSTYVAVSRRRGAWIREEVIKVPHTRRREALCSDLLFNGRYVTCRPSMLLAAPHYDTISRVIDSIKYCLISLREINCIKCPCNASRRLEPVTP